MRIEKGIKKKKVQARTGAIRSFWTVSIGLLTVNGLVAQDVKSKLATAFTQFQADSQLNHALVSFYVIDALTGEVVFDKNSG